MEYFKYLKNENKDLHLKLQKLREEVEDDEFELKLLRGHINDTYLDTLIHELQMKQERFKRTGKNFLVQIPSKIKNDDALPSSSEYSEKDLFSYLNQFISKEDPLRNKIRSYSDALETYRTCLNQIGFQHDLITCKTSESLQESNLSLRARIESLNQEKHDLQLELLKLHRLRRK